jgi:uncharacterized protein YacL
MEIILFLLGFIVLAMLAAYVGVNQALKERKELTELIEENISLRKGVEGLLKDLSINDTAAEEP